MSDQYTTISLPKSIGLSNFGKKSRSEMIREFREHARYELEQYKKILAADDSEFIVEQHRGVYRRTNIVRLP